jgi:Tol biopolymer transport system component
VHKVRLVIPVLGAATIVCMTVGVLRGHAATQRAAIHSVPVAREARDRLPVDLATKTLAIVSRGTHDRWDHIYIARADGSRLTQVDRMPHFKQKPSWSPDGRKIAFRYLARDDYSDTPIYVIDADGSHPINLTRRAGLLGGSSPTWSRDGRKIALSGKRTTTEKEGIYVMNADGSHPVRLTPTGWEAQYPAWSPDGTRIAFVVVHPPGFDIEVMNADGSQVRQLTHSGVSGGYNEWPMWSPASKRIAFDTEAGYAGGRSDIWVMNADGTHKTLLRAVGEHGGGVPAAWAPGAWIAFACPLHPSQQPPTAIGICAVRPDGTGFARLLGGRDAGFPAWKP